MRVLIVDDERNIRESIARYLDLEGMESAGAENGLSAQRLLQQEAFAAAIVDLKMPGMDGLELLRWLREDGPQIPVVMISAHGEIRDAVEAMKLGAQDYLVKPFDPEELVIRLKRIIEGRNLRTRVEIGRRSPTSEFELVGEGAAIQRIQGIIAKVASTPSSILVTGESGVGKEVIARAVHHASSVVSGPFVPVNVGGLPDTLLESELFGYERGAFTGAESKKLGMFELAIGGTLFLDEIGEMPTHLQVKLLRILQDKRVQRLGGTRQIPIDIRVIAATNKDLDAAVRNREFREDLYYRLNVVHIHVPPLRDRRDDIPLLVGYFIAKMNRKLGKRIEGIEPRALDLLVGHPWPGNVRELENAIERAIIFAESDTIRVADVGLSPGLSSPSPRGNSLREVERASIEMALQRWEGNRTRAAEELGITRRSLYNKIKEYGLTP